MLTMLGGRRLTVESLNIRAEARQDCPQGGVTFLWYLVVDSILVQFNSLGFYTVDFALQLLCNAIICGINKSTIVEVPFEKIRKILFKRMVSPQKCYTEYK